MLKALADYLFPRAISLLGNMLAISTVVVGILNCAVLYVGGNYFLMFVAAVLFLSLNALQPLLAILVTLSPRKQATEAAIVAASHPAAKFMKLAEKTVDALLSYQITAEQAVDEVLVPAIKAVATDAEKAAPDVLGKLKQEAGQ